MSDWCVESWQQTRGIWTRSGVLQTEGNAFAWYTRINMGVLEYLQGSSTVDNDTWSVTSHEFDLSASPNFDRIFQVPLSARRYWVTEHVRNTVYGLGKSEEHFVRPRFEEIDEDQQIDVTGIQTVYDAIDHTTIVGQWQLYDKNNNPAPFGKSAVRRVRI